MVRWLFLVSWEILRQPSDLFANVGLLPFHSEIVYNYPVQDVRAGGTQTQAPFWEPTRCQQLDDEFKRLGNDPDALSASCLAISDFLYLWAELQHRWVQSDNHEHWCLYVNFEDYLPLYDPALYYLRVALGRPREARTLKWKDLIAKHFRCTSGQLLNLLDERSICINDHQLHPQSDRNALWLFYNELFSFIPGVSCCRLRVT